MLNNMTLLPLELQVGLSGLLDEGVNEETIDGLVGQMLSALEQKSNKIQIDVWQIEESLSKKIDMIGEKLQGDLHTQLGATNAMIMDLREVQNDQKPYIEEAWRGVVEIKKLWANLDLWRTNVDAWRQQLAERLDEMEARIPSPAVISRIDQLETIIRQLNDLSDDIFISIDDQHNIELISQGVFELFGYSPSELIGKPLNTLIPLELQDEHTKHIEDFRMSEDITRRMGERLDIFGVHKDGSLKRVRASIAQHSGGFSARLRRSTGAKIT